MKERKVSGELYKDGQSFWVQRVSETEILPGSIPVNIPNAILNLLRLKMMAEKAVIGLGFEYSFPVIFTHYKDRDGRAYL